MNKQHMKLRMLHDKAITLGATCPPDCTFRNHNTDLVAKAAYANSEPKHWPAGAPDSKGGQFAPSATTVGYKIIDSSKLPKDSPAAPVPLLDSSGNPITDALGNPLQRPANIPPEHFVAAGENVKSLADRMLSNPPASESDLLSVGTQSAIDMAGFYHGFWNDAQRTDGFFVTDYRPYASIGVGLYCASAGISFEDCMERQNAFAWLFSNFKNQKMDDKYTNLPEFNVKNTRIGYDLYNSGKVHQ